MASRGNLDSEDNMSLTLSVPPMGHSEISEPHDSDISSIFVGGNYQSPRAGIPSERIMESGETVSRGSLSVLGDSENVVLTGVKGEDLLGDTGGSPVLSNVSSDSYAELSQLARELLSFGGERRSTTADLDFVLHIYKAFLQSIQVQNTVNLEVSKRIIQRLEGVIDRERRVSEREHQMNGQADLYSWHQRLYSEEVQFHSRQDEFEALVVRRVQECLEQITRQERNLRESSPSMHSA